MKKTAKSFLIGGIALVTAAAVGVGGFALLRLNRAPVKVVSLDQVAMTDMYWGGTQTWGTVRADNIQTVWLSDTQTVTGLLVEDGQLVKEGDPLLTYDTTLDGLQVQRKDLEVQEKERELYNLKKEYNQLCGYKAYALAADPREGRILLSLLAEVATETGEPLPETTEATEAPEPTETPTETPTEAPPESSEPPVTEPEPSSEPSQNPTETEDTGETTEPTEPTETEDPNVVTDYRILSGSGTEADPYLCVLAEGAPLPYELMEQYGQGDREVYVVFANTEGDRTDGIVTNAWEMSFSREGFRLYDASGYVGAPLQPVAPAPSDDPEPFYPGGGGGGGMSYEERQRMLREKALEIRDLDLELRVARVELKRMQAELGDGTVYAQMDGRVTITGDPETAAEYGEPLLRVSGGGGFRIDAQVDELSLETIVPGQTVSVSSWTTGETLEGVVETVSDYPTENNGWWGGGNQNVSYYSFTVLVDESAALSEGDPVDISYGSTESGGNSFYLELPFVRTENGKSYAFVRGEDGKLERRELITGRVVDNWCVEIRGGLTLEDFIAFPYGKNVTEGAKTVESDLDALYEEGGLY